MRIYLAAPLFSLAERNFNASLCDYLESMGHTVFLPQRDVKTKDGSDIFMQDLGALHRMDVMVVVLDGADHDSGTSWEAGYAYRKEIKYVGIRTDFRNRGDDDWGNIMLTRSCHHVIRCETWMVLCRELKTYLDFMGDDCLED